MGMSPFGCADIDTLTVGFLSIFWIFCFAATYKVCFSTPGCADPASGVQKPSLVIYKAIERSRTATITRISNSLILLPLYLS